MIITPENKVILTNRTKSLLWRLGMMVIAVVVDFAAANLELFVLPNSVTVIIGLVLGEVSKYLNKGVK